MIQFENNNNTEQSQEQEIVQEVPLVIENDKK